MSPGKCGGVRLEREGGSCLEPDVPLSSRGVRLLLGSREKLELLVLQLKDYISQGSLGTQNQ